MIDLVEIFENYACAAEYEFAYGRKDIQNWELTANKTFQSGETVLLLFPIIESANIDNSQIFSWNAATQIWLGRKFDVDIGSGTYSQLDETERQKYDRRLKDLRDDLATFVKSVFCGESDLELVNLRILREINQFDENLDFVVGELNFIADDS